jgi:hypothetical protein
MSAATDSSGEKKPPWERRQFNWLKKQGNTILDPMPAVSLWESHSRGRGIDSP